MGQNISRVKFHSSLSVFPTQGWGGRQWDTMSPESGLTHVAEEVGRR